MKFLALLLSLVAGPALAQGFQNEVSGSGSYTSLERSGAKTKLSVWDLAYGRFFSPQLVGTLALVRTDAEFNGGKADSTDLEAGAKYYFNPNLRKGSFVPFVDGGIGIVDGTGFSNEFKFRIGVGGAYFINDSVSVDPSFSYTHIATDPGVTTGWLLRLRLTARF